MTYLYKASLKCYHEISIIYALKLSLCKFHLANAFVKHTCKYIQGYVIRTREVLGTAILFSEAFIRSWGSLAGTV